ncbi:hypothetical protein [Terricaulis sp.]|uniref:hypothetical protein n=1 Tax=Terricaulis sp. TaxID=2768686 RepID=UPI0037843393
MSTSQTPQKGGVAGMMLLFCATAGGGGLAFDLTTRAHGFWIGAEPGARALIGVAAALFVAVAARAVQIVLSRREEKGAGDGRHRP